MAIPAQARAMRILVTGGSRFIGSAFIRQVLAETPWRVTNLDALTYAAGPDALATVDGGRSYTDQITFVADRPGHDRRYAIDAAKIAAELGCAPRETFDSGLERMVRWYLEQARWWKRLRAERYAGHRLEQGG